MVFRARGRNVPKIARAENYDESWIHGTAMGAATSFSVGPGTVARLAAVAVEFSVAIATVRSTRGAQSVRKLRSVLRSSPGKTDRLQARERDSKWNRSGEVRGRDG